MVNRRLIETWVGVFIFIGISALAMLAMQVSNITVITEQGGYNVTARFDNIGGLKVRSPVTMAGVRLGQVTKIEFDQNSYDAVVTMRIKEDYNALPIDTSASIYTSGVLGENYIGLMAGAESEYLEDGSQIDITQGALVLENLIGRIFVNQSSSPISIDGK